MNKQVLFIFFMASVVLGVGTWIITSFVDASAITPSEQIDTNQMIEGVKYKVVLSDGIGVRDNIP